MPGFFRCLSRTRLEKTRQRSSHSRPCKHEPKCSCIDRRTSFEIPISENIFSGLSLPTSVTHFRAFKREALDPKKILPTLIFIEADFCTKYKLHERFVAFLSFFFFFFFWTPLEVLDYPQDLRPYVHIVIWIRGRGSVSWCLSLLSFYKFQSLAR